MRSVLPCFLLVVYGVVLENAAPAQAPVPAVPGRPAPVGEPAEAPKKPKLPVAFPDAHDPKNDTSAKKSDHDDARGLIRRMRESDDPAVRARALEMLPLDVAKEADFARLFAAANDSDMQARQSAQHMLDQCAAKDLFAYVIRTLSWGVPEHVKMVDATLPQLAPRVGSMMTGTLETELESARHRLAAAYCLGRMGVVDAAPVLAKFAWSDQADLAETCAMSLKMLRAPGSDKDWKGMLTHSNPTIRMIAVRSLGDLDTLPARHALLETALGQNTAGRAAQQEAAHMIARWDAADSIPALIEVMRQNRAIDSIAVRHLREKTGKNFGPSPDAWIKGLQEASQPQADQQESIAP